MNDDLFTWRVAHANEFGAHHTAARLVAERAHAGQTDKQGVDYMVHVEAVAAGVDGDGDRAVTAALLHDVVEDTDITLFDLFQLGFPLDVLEVVQAVTRRDGESYSEFIDRVCAAGHIARQVKLADLTHNLDDSRGPRPDALTVRYNDAVARITAADAEWLRTLKEDS